jgi:hypothetical protein
MTALVARRAVPALFVLASLIFTAACGTTGGVSDEGEPVFIEDESAPQGASEAPMARAGAAGKAPPGAAEKVLPNSVSPGKELDEVIVEARRERHQVIGDLVSEAKSILRDVELEYVFTGTGKREVLRGRPVVFALWSDAQQEWSIVHLEIPRPPSNWKPGRKPFPFIVRTPGVEAWHVKGTGAERLMFAFTKDGEPLKVYGRKFPVFDSALIAKKRWRAVVETARPIVYLPFNADTLDPFFVSGGKEFLLDTARRAIDELRLAKAPSVSFPGVLLADVVPAEVITTLAVIEQTDDADFVNRKAGAVDEVLSQYGLKREEAYRYSVSSAAAVGPMQFTDRRTF